MALRILEKPNFHPSKLCNSGEKAPQPVSIDAAHLDATWQPPAGLLLYSQLGASKAKLQPHLLVGAAVRLVHGLRHATVGNGVRLRAPSHMAESEGWWAARHVQPLLHSR